MDRLQSVLPVLDVRKGVEEAFSIWVHGLSEDFLKGAFLYNPSCIHYSYVVADFSYDAQVMGDHDHGSVVFFLQIAHKLQYLCLDGYIQSCGRLIGNEKLRVAGQGNGYDYSLLHATGELVGIFVKSLARNTYQFQHISSLLHGFFLLQLLMDHDGFSNLLTDGENRVQGCHRILEDH